MKFLMLPFVLLFAFTSAALAQQNEVTARFRDAAMTVILQLESEGVQHLQNIPLADIKKVALEVPLVHYPNLTFKVGNRNCALWQPDISRIQYKGHIYLNKDCKNVDDAQLRKLALHEILGFGFNADRNYEITAEVFTRDLTAPPATLLDWGKFLENKRASASRSGGGGSVGVGGGGDLSDLRFKMEGLNFLNEIPDSDFHGIPKELLRLALLHLNVWAASDIANIAEFRSATRDINRQPVIYVHSSLHRNPEPSAALGPLAALAARLFIIHAPQYLGLTDVSEDASAIKVPYLVIPVDKTRFMTFENKNLTATMSEEDKEKALALATQDAARKANQSSFEQMLQTHERTINVAL